MVVVVVLGCNSCSGSSGSSGSSSSSSRFVIIELYLIHFYMILLLFSVQIVHVISIYENGIVSLK